MNEKMICPLCGGCTSAGKCKSCGYIIPDEYELDEMTRLMNTDPEDYPESEAARIDFYSEHKNPKPKYTGKYEPPKYNLRDIRKEPYGNNIPAPAPAPAENESTSSDETGDFYSMISEKLDVIVKQVGEDCTKVKSEMKFFPGMLYNFAIILLPTVLHLIVTAILILFSFSGKKHIIISAVAMSIFLAFKIFLHFY